MRGEYQHKKRGSEIKQGSPPHARGILRLPICHHHQSGITPACAGNTVSVHCRDGSVGDHPRMRGEYPYINQNFVYLPGSPPHARGIPFVCHSIDSPFGITPACAGNTVMFTLAHRAQRDHPRMRGEYHVHPIVCALLPGSPPHARGIPILWCRKGRTTGITPACAGNTGRMLGTSILFRDHPRMRGEYLLCFNKFSINKGSPPHARGILLRKSSQQGTRGITPACAGNTWNF